jgi:pancreatic lipase-related protein 2
MKIKIEKLSEFLAEGANMNIFYVDWFNLSSSICYPAVVHSIKHVGECTGQLIRRIRDAGSDDVHIIGFSLGAQVINYVAESLKPDFQIKHVTGLDPALPGFINVDVSRKLDPSDALFVDVYHCNVRAFRNFANITLIFAFQSFIQSKIERCGHFDIYYNNAIMQPGCGSCEYTSVC